MQKNIPEEHGDDVSIETLLFSMTKELIRSNEVINPDNKIDCFFELILFYSCYILRRIIQVRPEVYDSFCHTYLLEIYYFAIENRLLSKIQSDYPLFINNRMSFYLNQIDAMFNAKRRGDIYLPGRLLYFFYDNPLAPIQHGNNTDTLKYGELLMCIGHHFKAINDGIDYVIETQSL